MPPPEDNKLDMGEVLKTHIGISHTRWATHGVPAPVNAHPQPSDAEKQFICVHNGTWWRSVGWGGGVVGCGFGSWDCGGVLCARVGGNVVFGSLIMVGYD